MPPDELPLGVQERAQVPARGERRADGTFAPGARTVQSMGGRTAAGRTKLTARLGLGALASDSEFRPYKSAAATFRRVQCQELARTVGGGRCGPGPASIVASAALCLGWSRFLSDRAARELDGEAAAKALGLADRARQMLLTAHELCAREAEARARGRRSDPQADLRAQLLSEPASSREPSGGTAS